MYATLKCLWMYRYFVFTSIINELIGSFSRSKIAGLWVIINPLSQVLIYTLILSNILQAKLPGIEGKYSYAIYLMAGLLAWNLFSEIINRSLVLFIQYGNLLKKMNFPRITLPVIIVGSCGLNNLLLFISMLAIFLVLGHQFSINMFWIIPLTLLVMLLAIGIGLILGVMNVFLRDIGQVVPIILQMLFWFTPIVYPVNILPENIRYLLRFNPLFEITDAYHTVLVYNRMPDLSNLALITVAAVVIAALALFMFRRASAEMADAL
jgi:homopolymeric O-antigen transport system permease protein